MLYSLDRFEGEVAVLVADDEQIIVVPRDRLPASVQPGDLLHEAEGTYRVDADETQTRRDAILRLQRKLRR